MSQAAGLLALSTVELRRRIGTKEISPVELLEAAIERIAALNPAVGFVTLPISDMRMRARGSQAATPAASRQVAKASARKSR